MAITPLPTPPAPTDSPQDFNTKAFDLLNALPDFVTETNATAVQVDADKTTTTGAASTATTKANEASASADLAEDWATKTDGAVAGGEFSAKKYAQDSSDSADASAASAVEAAGLVENYQGALASDPSLNKDGDPLAAGDWYVNTSTGLIRAYTGSVWVTSVNVTAGVSSFSGGSTGLTPSTGTQGDITLSGTLDVDNGGTGSTSLAANNVLLGNGTSALQVVAPGTSGNVLTSNGTTWTSAASVIAEIKTPTNVSPANAATNIGETPVLTGSTFYSLYGIAMTAAQWQVSTVSNFATTVISTGDVAGTGVTYNVASGVLSPNTTYYWRVRYKDANGVYSEWSTGTSFTTAASFGPSIGDAYGGGFYAGKIVQGGTTYYVVVAPKSSGENSSKQWKTTADAGPTATQTLNNGPAASASMNSATYPAAQFCEGLSIGGYTDWYLPSRDELELCYRNLKPTTGANDTSARPKSSYTYSEGNDVSGDTMGINRNSSPTGAAYTSGSPAQTAVTAFKSGGTEAFAAVAYWSSSESSATYAWLQDFNDGSQNDGLKDNSRRVRAVRRVAV